MISRWQLVTNEWRRRPLRSAVSALGVALALAASFCLAGFQRGYRQGMEAELGRLGAHVLVVPKGCPYDAASLALHGANWPCHLRMGQLEGVRAVRFVESAAPAFMAAFPVAEGRQEVLVGATAEMLALKPGWQIRGAFPQRDDEVLLGADFARRSGLEPGKEVRFRGVPGRRFVVSGVLGVTGAAEDGFAFLRLEAAQRELGHPGRLTHILVKLHDPKRVDEAVLQLRGCEAGMDMNVVPLSHLFRTIQRLVDATRLWLFAVAGVAVVVAVAGVSNALTMSVAERSREFAVLRALGASGAELAALVACEALQVCLAGSVAGFGIALAGAHTLERALRARLPFAPTDSLVQFDATTLVWALAGALFLGLFAALLPLWRTLRVDPIEALRDPEAV